MEEIIVIDLSKNEIITLDSLGKNSTKKVTGFEWIAPNQIKLKKNNLIEGTLFFKTKTKTLDYLGIIITGKAYFVKEPIVI